MCCAVRLIVYGEPLVIGPSPCPDEAAGRYGARCTASRETRLSDGGTWWAVAAHGVVPDFPNAREGCGGGTRATEGGCRVNEEHVFVLGDTRDDSFDSRHFGAVPVQSVKGRALKIFLSFDGALIRWERLGLTL